jgi:acyl-CoA thioesterase-2
LEQIAFDRFRGWCRDGLVGRVFGGQVAAQALAAAGADLVHGWLPISIHAYFVREGRSAAPIEYRVERMDVERMDVERMDVERTDQDDPEVRLRRITASQSDRAILILDAAFHAPGCDSKLVPFTPGPEPATWTPPGPAEERWLAEHSRRFGFDLRFVDRPGRIAGGRGEISHGQRFWLRTAARLPDEALHHACALTCASDMFLVSTALAVHGLPGRRPDVQAASLDHSIWFHRSARADEWVLYEQASPTSAGGRGLSTGRLLDRTGAALVATVCQEVLQRLPD